MSNWRKVIKTFFADALVDAFAGELKKFGPWNNQPSHMDEVETFGPLAIFFEYSVIGDGLEYLNLTGVQQAERIPVEVTLHIVFNRYTEEYQDLAYEHAESITCALSGKKHDFIHGRILKVSEVEDTNHRGQYDYQISFGFQLKEAVFVSGADLLEDANPEVEEDAYPPTGRRLIPTIVNVGRNS